MLYVAMVTIDEDASQFNWDQSLHPITARQGQYSKQEIDLVYKVKLIKIKYYMFISLISIKTRNMKE